MSTASVPESFGVKLNYNGQMRRFPIALGTSFKDLRAQVIALLALPHDADVALKYADEEGDLITISSDLELNSALVPGSLLRLTAIDKKPTGPVSYPILDAPMLDAAPTIAPLLQGVPDQARSFGGVGPQGVPHGAPPGFGPAAGFGPAPPCFAPPPAPGFDNMGQQGFGGPHQRGGHHGPYRGGLGFRGGWGHHGRGFGHHGRHAHGPYGHHMPPHGAMSPEDWRTYKKDCKEMAKDMKKEWKDSRKNLKKDWKEGRGFRCADGMQWGVAPGAADEQRFVARFAKDVTIPDGTTLAPNTPFVKTWRLRNEGAAWPAGCVLRFLGKKSDRMSCPETVALPVEGPVATNAELDVSVNLVAPEKPGRYTGYWKMSTPDGRKFGQRVWVSIVVPGSHSSSSSDSDREADRYEAMVDAVLATGLKAKRHRILRMLKKTDGQVDLVCAKLVKKEEKMARKAMKKQMKM